MIKQQKKISAKNKTTKENASGDLERKSSMVKTKTETTSLDGLKSKMDRTGGESVNLKTENTYSGPQKVNLKKITSIACETVTEDVTLSVIGGSEGGDRGWG